MPVKTIGRHLAALWNQAKTFSDAARRELFEETGMRMDAVGQELTSTEDVIFPRSFVALLAEK